MKYSKWNLFPEIEIWVEIKNGVNYWKWNFFPEVGSDEKERDGSAKLVYRWQNQKEV